MFNDIVRTILPLLLRATAYCVSRATATCCRCAAPAAALPFDTIARTFVGAAVIVIMSCFIASVTSLAISASVV